MVYIEVYKMQILRTETGYQLDALHVASKPHSKLPTQQARTLLYVAQGLSQQSIATEMGVKPSTVKKACSELSYRFHSHSMRETVFIALKEGVLRYVMCIFLCVSGSLNTDIHCLARISRTPRTSRSSRIRESHTNFSIL
ncbi:helix-turn-helix transcriptional regulator [Alteromonas sp. P256]|uniref:helix-turn-helix transcriptional regulator n=1 Tax=Alteromonas sp. P256 TaxID=3117399 RepID=UPI003F68A1C8